MSTLDLLVRALPGYQNVQLLHEDRIHRWHELVLTIARARSASCLPEPPAHLSRLEGDLLIERTVLRAVLVGLVVILFRASKAVSADGGSELDRISWL